TSERAVQRRLHAGRRSTVGEVSWPSGAYRRCQSAQGSAPLGPKAPLEGASSAVAIGVGGARPAPIPSVDDHAAAALDPGRVGLRGVELAGADGALARVRPRTPAAGTKLE